MPLDYTEEDRPDLPRHLTLTELLSIVFQSRWYVVYNVVLFVLTIVLLLYSFTSGFDAPVWFAVLEGLITILFVLEIAACIFADGWKVHFSSKLAILEFIVVILCVLAFIVTVADPDWENVDIAFIAVRCTAQTVRMFFFARRALQRSTSQNHLQFTQLNEDLEDPEPPGPPSTRSVGLAGRPGGAGGPPGSPSSRRDSMHHFSNESFDFDMAIPTLSGGAPPSEGAKPALQ